MLLVPSETEEEQQSRSLWNRESRLAYNQLIKHVLTQKTNDFLLDTTSKTGKMIPEKREENCPDFSKTSRSQVDAALHFPWPFPGKFQS